LFADPHWLVLPGGMPGAENLYNFAPLAGLLERHAKSTTGRIAAICASPAVVLGQLGLLKGQKATCYPGFEKMLSGVQHIDAPVVVSGKFVTGNGPANAMAWALAIVREELGSLEALHLANSLLLYPRNQDDVDHYFG
jgi:4-methyl-5(b-hydroxyethyl)-thiazole monophosphate biosynthesis